MEDGQGISRTGRLSMRTEMESSTYVIRREDKIELSVWGYPEFTTSAIVKETGTIVVPLVGEVPAAGLTKEQFTEQMRQKLSEYIQGEAKLTISVLSSERTWCVKFLLTCAMCFSCLVYSGFFE